jgi:Zn-dependent protease
MLVIINDIITGMQLDLTSIIIMIVVLLLSMTLHEAMHAFAGYWLGDDTAHVEGRLTLNPLAHIDPFLTIGLPLVLIVTSVLSGGLTPIFGGAKPVPFNPTRVRWGDFGAALVGVAGPLTNFVIALLAFAVYALSGQPTNMFGEVLLITVMINLGFFIFNMIPIPPLDGSRVLYAIAPDGARNFMEMIERNGIIVVFAIVFLFSSQIGMLIQGIEWSILRVFYMLFGIAS